jgi:hypothetical protein
MQLMRGPVRHGDGAGGGIGDHPDAVSDLMSGLIYSKGLLAAAG